MTIQEQILKLKEPYLQTINCLDKGFVRLVDWMGDDSRIVQAARVSYGEGTKSIREDKGLIDYLIRHSHTSPLEQVQFTFHSKKPIFVARQVVRHRTAKLNEISGRYSIMKDEFYVPEPNQICLQSKDNKQGRSEPLPYNDAMDIIRQMEHDQEKAYSSYTNLIDKDIARELARVNLPLSLYTEWYWTIDLHNLLHFLKLRLDPHAQYEVRVYAQAKYDLIKNIVPYTCESFERHTMNSKKFSSDEWNILTKILGNTDKIKEEIQKLGWKQSKTDEFLKKLE